MAAKQVKVRVVIGGGGFERGTTINVDADDRRIGSRFVVVGDKGRKVTPEDIVADEAFQSLKASVVSDDDGSPNPV